MQVTEYSHLVSNAGPGIRESSEPKIRWIKPELICLDEDNAEGKVASHWYDQNVTVGPS